MKKVYDLNRFLKAQEMMYSWALKEMKKGKYKRILVAATGALMNPLTVLQGESIPTISHAVTISA